MTQVTWTLDKKILIPLTLILVGAASGYTTYSSTGTGLDYLQGLSEPREILTGFVAPFLLIALIFQRGYERALGFSLAEDDSNPLTGTDQSEQVGRTALIMSLATASIIVPTPYFPLIRDWVASLFTLIGVGFFGAIFAGFFYILWKAFS